jgi:pimeloyl-ACP methyl ester carboxylesterase
VALDTATVQRAVTLAQNDPEIGQLRSVWSGSVAIGLAEQTWRLEFDPAGVALAAGDGPAADYTVRGPAEAWALVLSDPPGPGYVDFADTSRVATGCELSPAPDSVVPHLLLRRLSELLRHAAHGTDPAARPLPARSRRGQHDQRVGRYLHLDLDGADHAVYYESAGTGIPILCQHTAGSDSRQWRHLLEDDRVLDRFQVIAYDLPRHGKSLPPESVAWWTEEYLLTTEKAMAVPLALAEALELDRPLFLGSSIGGMLALDLARWHPERFRGVIALEASLTVPDGDVPDAQLRRGRYVDTALYASGMWGVMPPSAPETYRHETWLHYAQGAPTIFSGDSHYYLVDHDLTTEAAQIDTTRCPVYLLSGEYDWQQVPQSRHAADQIPGATFQLMSGLGHFPMSEDHEQLMGYLLKILDAVAQAAG